MTLDVLRPREYGCQVVFALRGELDVLDADSVAAVLMTAVVRNPLIILDLTALTYIDCYALGKLVRIRAQAQQSGLETGGPFTQAIERLPAQDQIGDDHPDQHVDRHTHRQATGFG